MKILKLTVFWALVWGVAWLTTKLSDFTLFESFVIAAFGGLLGVITAGGEKVE